MICFCVIPAAVDKIATDIEHNTGLLAIAELLIDQYLAVSRKQCKIWDLDKWNTNSKSI